MRYDIAIIGTGPAGVSAAITAKIRNKNIILFGSEKLSDKLTRAHRILNYTGLPDISGAELSERMREQLSGLGIEITEKQVSAVYSMGEYFGIQAGGEMFEASSCILAGGVSMENALPGEDKFLGRGVSYCATCDGQFYKGRTVAVIGCNEEALTDARFLSELCERLYFIPAGKLAGKTEYINTEPGTQIENADAEDINSFKSNTADEAEKAKEAETAVKSDNDENAGHKNIILINERALEITGALKADTVRTDKAEYRVDGVFVIRDAVAPDKLVPGLKTDGRHVITDIQMTTNMPGMFVAGDAAGEPYQYIKAAGQGNVAAISAVRYLDSKKM